MNALFRSYQNLLTKFPIGIQAIQTGLLMGSGDLIAQTVVEKKKFKQINLVRMGQFALIGTVVVGPSLTVWYRVLEKYFGKAGKWAAVKKMSADQFVFAPFFLAVLMGIVGAAQKKTLNEIGENLKSSYPDVLKTNYKIWPAVQLCNFYLMPLQYQVVTVQIVAIFWNTYLSWKLNNKGSLFLYKRNRTTSNFMKATALGAKFF